jgi:hypothetical protein
LRSAVEANLDCNVVKVSELQSRLAEQASTPEIEAATRLGSAASKATQGLASALSSDAMKSINEAAKAVTEIGSKSGIAEAVKSAGVARDIVGPRITEMRPPVGLSAEAMRWQAEKAAAPVQTRDAVWALADAVESLAESQRHANEAHRHANESRRRADKINITVAVAILALTALLVLKEFL